MTPRTLLRFWYDLGITQKFGTIIGAVLTLIIFLTGLHIHFMAASNSRTESDLTASAHIQALVLQMDAGLERARRLKREFSLKYAGYDRFDPNDDIARQIHDQLIKVAEYSDRLRSLIHRSNVSEALRKTHINLNLYFSMATRNRSVFTEMAELVRQQTRAETGLLFRFLETEQALSDLLSQTGNTALMSLFQQCRLHAKDYIVTRQRPAMQSVLNDAFLLQKAVAETREMADSLKTRITDLLTDHLDTAEKIPAIDSRIRSKSNEFDLNTDTLASVSADLIRLVNQEIEATRAKSRKTVTLLGRMLFLSALGAILLVGLLALVIHRTITRHIQGLTLAASRLQKGDLDARIRLESNDELGRLSQGFNRMAGQLKYLISDLETQVLKRTRDLETSNRSLQREIREKEKLAHDLRQAHKMEAVGTLSGGIAHDFNNILGIILGNTELADDDIPEWNPAKENLKEIRVACLRAKEVVRQLLSFSRKTSQEHRSLKLITVVEETLQLVRASIPATIDIVQELPPDSSPIVADPTQIHQVILNLISNAAHAMNEGGTLTIRVREVNLTEADCGARLSPGLHVEFSVTDTGIGIDQDIIDKIFDPYFTTKDVGKGTGMGLAVVHGIVMAHGADIRIQSRPGHGSRFTILFPAVDAAVTPETENSQEILEGQGRILVVDDEPALATMVEQMLNRMGYDAVSLTEPEMALDAVHTAPDRYDLIITDMTMPGFTGRALAEKIQAIRPDLPLILITGFHESVSAETAAQYGFSSYIEKPVNKAELARAVRDVLENGPG